MYLRREQPGSTSTGHTWIYGGQIIEIPDKVGGELLAIEDAGFTAVNPDDLPDGWDRDPDDDKAPDDEDPAPDDTVATAVTEPAPDPAAAITEPAPTPDATDVVTEPAQKRRTAKPKE